MEAVRQRQPNELQDNHWESEYSCGEFMGSTSGTIMILRIKYPLSLSSRQGWDARPQ